MLPHLWLYHSNNTKLELVTDDAYIVTKAKLGSDLW